MKIYSYTVVRSSSVDFQDRTPYLIAVLEDANGNRISSILEGYSEGAKVEIGMPVTEASMEDGSLVYTL